MFNRILLIGLLIVLLVGCTEVEVADDLTPDEFELIAAWSLNSVYKLEDEGNVCYVYVGFEKGGISCLRLGR